MGGGASKKSQPAAAVKAQSSSAPPMPEAVVATVEFEPIVGTNNQNRSLDEKHADVTGETSQPSAVATTLVKQQSASTLTVSEIEFASIVGDAFGPMIPAALVSNKWDRKVDALKNVIEVMKRKLVQPSNLATPAERQHIHATNQACFRAVCLVLHRSTCDKILPVLLASHELLRTAFRQAESIIPEEELCTSLDSLLANVWTKVGDSNIRLHDSSKGTIIFAAGLHFYSLTSVLERLQGLISEKSRGHMRAKQISGVVDTVCTLVESFPARDQLFVAAISSSRDIQMWTMDQIAPFIESGLDDVVGPRTRLGAVKLAGAAFSKLGREAMQPLLQSLRPAVSNLVLQKFDELEESLDAEPEIEEVPEMEQISIKQPSEPVTSRPPIGSRRPMTGGTRPQVSKKPPSAEPKQVECPLVRKPTQMLEIKSTPAAEVTKIKTPATPKAGFSPSPRNRRLAANSQSLKHTNQSSSIQCPREPKWASDMSRQEEDIMDQILEETGLVFGKSEKLGVGLDEEFHTLGLRGPAISCC